VPLALAFTDPESYVASYQLSNGSGFTDAARVPAANAPSLNQTVSWAPLPGTGSKAIWVRVTNGAGGTTTQTVQIQVGGTTVPGAPQGFTLAKNDAAMTATITWTPPSSTGGSAITGYRVERSAGGGKPAWSTTVAATARSQTFKSLTPGATFTLSVQAVNAVGAGPAASGAVTIGSTATVPAAPVIGTAKSGTAGGAVTAKARWAPPTSTGGSAITGYRVRALRISSTGTVHSTANSRVLSASARSRSMTLPHRGKYRFRVKAINIVGAGPQSARSNLVTGR
jgi:predicted phage tail protein